MVPAMAQGLMGSQLNLRGRERLRRQRLTTPESIAAPGAGVAHVSTVGGPEADVMVTGMVKWFDSKKGFGFIKGPEEDKDIFVHYTHIEGDGFRSLKDGESVEFDLVESDKGLQAHHVKRVGTKPSTESQPQS